MKTAKTTFVISFISLIFLGSCEKEPVARTLDHGTWEVAAFSENGVDETFQFLGYEFVFHKNEKVEATRGNSKVIGTWSTGSDYDRNELYLYFNTDSPLRELNEDWQIIENKPSRVRMAHTSGANGGNDELTLQRQN